MIASNGDRYHAVAVRLVHGRWRLDAVHQDPPPERWVLPIVRLKPGVTSVVVTEQLQAVEGRLQSEHPNDFPKNPACSFTQHYMDITVAPATCATV